MTKHHSPRHPPRPTPEHWDPYAIHVCRDCGVQEGYIHDFGCEMERCPFCGGQLISCDCCYTLTGLYDPQRYDAATAHLAEDVYAHGLPEREARQWRALLEARGRVPFMQYPYFCIRCGQPWCALFHVSDAEWRQYIQPNMRDQILCRQCYDWIVQRIAAAGQEAIAAAPPPKA